ncbi:MAG TPA: LysR family transcriptional regulator [Thermomicrobiales bacterium]|jgi:DNA-binding transcriptional LysR family regulator|nr:LysR family transcriptional regulator [Thermomicrobiales bacterium]
MAGRPEREPGLNLVSLRVFADVIALGSFTAAGERSGMSQPAVSLHIRQLETRFGQPLLLRDGRRAVPTPAGAELLRHALAVTAAVDDTLAAMHRYDPAPGDRLRVATAASACVALLPPVLREMRERFPALDMSVTTGSSPEIVCAIEEDRADVGLMSLPVTSSLLRVVPLLEDEIVLLAPEGMALPDAVPASELREQPPMVFEPEGNTRALIDRWFDAAGVPFQPATAIASIEAIRELVGLGVGAALVSRMVLPATGPAPGTVVRSLVPGLRRTLVRVTRRDRTTTAPAETFGVLLDRRTRDWKAGIA